MACAATYQDHPDFAFYLENGCEDWSDTADRAGEREPLEQVGGLARRPSRRRRAD
jgi:hypothetical protein